MWNQTLSPSKPPASPQLTSPQLTSPQLTSPQLTTPPPRPTERPHAAVVGKSVVIQGELIGDEDLTIDGRVEGRIELRDHTLLIGPNGKIEADVMARTITIMGAVIGHVTATDRVDIRQSGSVVGDIDAPKVAMADGAQLRGKIDTLSATKAQPQPLSLAV